MIKRLTTASLALLATSAAVADTVLLPGDARMHLCAPGERNTSSKTCVVDGDTLWLHGVKYRLADFDTPEPQNVAARRRSPSQGKRARVYWSC